MKTKWKQYVLMAVVAFALSGQTALAAKNNLPQSPASQSLAAETKLGKNWICFYLPERTRFCVNEDNGDVVIDKW